MDVRVAALLCCVAFLAAGCSSTARPAASSEPPQRGPRELVPALPGVEKCSGVPLVPLADLAAYDTQRVAVDGVPAVRGACTLLDCRDWKNGAVACCNRCSGAYVLHVDVDRGIDVLLDDVGTCGGMDCDFHCEPFGTHPTRAYRFVGSIDAELTLNKAVLIVDTVCALGE